MAELHAYLALFLAKVNKGRDKNDKLQLRGATSTKEGEKYISEITLPPHKMNPDEVKYTIEEPVSAFSSKREARRSMTAVLARHLRTLFPIAEVGPPVSATEVRPPLQSKLGHIFTTEAGVIALATAVKCPSTTGEVTEDHRTLALRGDALITHIVTEELYGGGITQPGELTKAVAVKVSNAKLNAVGRRAGIHEYLEMANQTDTQAKKAVATAVEAIICAAFIDGGHEAATAVWNHIN